MNIARWILALVAVAFTVAGHFTDQHWMFFVTVAVVIVLAATGPQREMFQRRQRS